MRLVDVNLPRAIHITFVRLRDVRDIREAA